MSSQLIFCIRVVAINNSRVDKNAKKRGIVPQSTTGDATLRLQKTSKILSLEEFDSAPVTFLSLFN